MVVTNYRVQLVLIHHCTRYTGSQSVKNLKEQIHPNVFWGNERLWWCTLHFWARFVLAGAWCYNTLAELLETLLSHRRRWPLTSLWDGVCEWKYTTVCVSLVMRDTSVQQWGSLVCFLELYGSEDGDVSGFDTHSTCSFWGVGGVINKKNIICHTCPLIDARYQSCFGVHGALFWTLHQCTAVAGRKSVAQRSAYAPTRCITSVGLFLL